MKIACYASRLLIFLLAASILLMGCHSYYTIPKDDYTNIEKIKDVKIVYTNGKEFIVEKDDTTNINIIGDSLIVSQGSKKQIIGMSEVEKLKESRFDLGGTITVIIIPLIILVAYFFANFSFY